MKDEIHTAAELAPQNGILDNEIYDADVIEAFASSSHKCIEVFLDVPISNLVALRPRDFYIPGSTWRKAALGLHCEGWDQYRDDIVEYFTSELKLKPFPAPKSESELRIGITGGAVYCKIGNHRAAASKAWLAHNQNELAILEKASCYYRPVNRSLKQLMEKCIEDGSKLKYCHIKRDEDYIKHPLKSIMYSLFRSRGISNLVLVEKADSSCILYSFDSDCLDLNREDSSLKNLSKILKFDLLSITMSLGFKEVPLNLMKLMLSEIWGERLQQTQY